MVEKRGLPPWVWIGCGCAGALAAIVVVVVGIGFWGVHKARELAEEMADPDARSEKALEILGAEALPEGYYPVAAFSVPFVFDFAVLSDEPPEADGSPSERSRNGFLFTSFPSIGEGDDELYGFFEGRTDDIASLRREQFDIDLKERLAYGRLERARDEILWVSHRGRVNTREHDDSHDGLITMLLIECGDERRRIGIWFGPDPSPGTGADSLDTRGTVADVSEIELFMRPINPCR